MELLRHQMEIVLVGCLLAGVLVGCLLAKCFGKAAYEYFPRVPQICHERRGVLCRNVCIYYVWSSTVELTYNAHLECSAYCSTWQVAMSLAPFTAYQSDVTCTSIHDS